MKQFLGFLSKNIYLLIILILIGIIIFLRSCRTQCPEVQIKTDTIVKYDTTLITITKDKPVPYSVILPPDTFTKVVHDSNFCKDIAVKYYTKNYYSNVFLDDTSAFIKLSGLVYQNRLQDVKMDFINRRATTIINTTEISKPVVKFYIGFSLGSEVKKLSPTIDAFHTGVNVMLQTKKDDMYSLYYDPFKKDVIGTIWFKIRLRKKNP